MACPFAQSFGWLDWILHTNVLGDPKSFTQKKNVSPSAIYKTLWQDHKQELLTIFLIDLLVAVGFYIVVTFLVGYLENFVGLSRQYTLVLNMVSMLIFAISIFITGSIVDRVGVKPLLAFSASWDLSCSASLSFYGFLSRNLFWLIILSQVSLATLMGIYFSIIPVVLVSSFPVHIRYSGYFNCTQLEHGYFWWQCTRFCHVAYP